MKLQSTNLLQTLSNDEIKTLTTQTQEKLLTTGCSKKQLTAAEMWSIQRQRKVFQIRKFSW